MAEPIQVDFSGRGDNGRKKEVKRISVIPPERAGLRILLSAIGAVITALVAFYVMLPPLNFKAQEFYLYLGICIGSFVALLFLLCGASSKPEYVPFVRKTARIPIALIVVIALFFGAAWAISSPFFQARRYHELMPVQTDASFDHYLAEADFSAIPRLDADAAMIVADRALGDLADYVSQFTISDSNTQINYQNKPVRVVPLAYADLIKWFVNTREGLPGYIIVDMANEVSKFVKLEHRIRYSDEEHFGKLLKRHLRFEYPTYLFSAMNFEIDDDGNPYWVVPRMDKTIGLLGGEDVIGIILVDAVTGECVEYNMEQVRTLTELQWIDRVFTADLLTAQFNFFGKYVHGFWNSLLGQKDVRAATEGYAYIAKDDDVFKYTGVSSVTADQSIIGFTIINQRTKEAHFYRVNGATESSAETTAKGLVQAQGWTTTFPLLINVSGQPTYFLSLKDNSGVLQGYSMINVKDYNKIKVWAETVAACKELYLAAITAEGIQSPDEQPDTSEQPDDQPALDQEQVAKGAISDIRTAVINGNTTYYIQLEGGVDYYVLTAALHPNVVLLSRGDAVAITFAPMKESNILRASKIEWPLER